MGKQLPIIASSEDQRQLLRFIQTQSPVRVFVMHQPTIEELWIDDWETKDIKDTFYHVWLKNFPWTPEYLQTGGPRCPEQHRGLWYVSNSSAAPVLDISPPISNSRRGGRIYWARNFSGPSGLAYNDVAFAKIVDRIWSWIRRNGKRPPETKRSFPPYYLPEAWAKYQAENS